MAKKSSNGNRGLTDPRNEKHPRDGVVNGDGTVVLKHVKIQYRRRAFRAMWRDAVNAYRPGGRDDIFRRFGVLP